MRVRRWGVVGLVLITTLAVGSFSLWLVPPYWVIMGWLLAPPEGWRRKWRGGSSETDHLPERGVATGPEANPPNVEDRPQAGETSPDDPPPDSGPAVKPRRRKRSSGSRSKKKVQNEPEGPEVAATWVRVGPNQFVRVEVPVERSEEVDPPRRVDTSLTEVPEASTTAEPAVSEAHAVPEQAPVTDRPMCERGPIHVEDRVEAGVHQEDSAFDERAGTDETEAIASNRVELSPVVIETSESESSVTPDEIGDVSESNEPGAPPSDAPSTTSHTVAEARRTNAPSRFIKPSEWSDRGWRGDCGARLLEARRSPLAGLRGLARDSVGFAPRRSGRKGTRRG